VVKILIEVYCVVLLCSLVNDYKCFGGMVSSTLKMEVIHSTETLATTYKTTQHNKPENHN
jgi:hypothetical protein